MVLAMRDLLFGEIDRCEMLSDGDESVPTSVQIKGNCLSNWRRERGVQYGSEVTARPLIELEPATVLSCFNFFACTISFPRPPLSIMNPPKH